MHFFSALVGWIDLKNVTIWQIKGYAKLCKRLCHKHDQYDKEHSSWSISKVPFPILPNIYSKTFWQSSNNLSMHQFIARRQLRKHFNSLVFICSRVPPPPRLVHHSKPLMAFRTNAFSILCSIPEKNTPRTVCLLQTNTLQVVPTVTSNFVSISAHERFYVSSALQQNDARTLLVCDVIN